MIEDNDKDNDKMYQAVVDKVIRDGRHGPYAVARCEELEGSVTFALGDDVWQERDWPERGMYVMLSKIRKKARRVARDVGPVYATVR